MSGTKPNARHENPFASDTGADPRAKERDAAQSSVMTRMPDQGGTQRRRRRVVPPFAGENHVCDTCEMDFARVSVADALAVISSLPDWVREAVSTVPLAAQRSRPAQDRWSVTEYVCHLRDIYATYTIRLYRARTEPEPVVEPMLNDLRVRRFRYNERDVHAVLDELGATVAGFCDEVAQTTHWDRLVTRLPGEYRTALWLVRQAMHEGQHHLNDIRWTISVVSPTNSKMEW